MKIWKQRHMRSGRLNIGRGILRIALLILCIGAGVALLQELYRGLRSDASEKESIFQVWLEDMVTVTWTPSFGLWKEQTEISIKNPFDRLVTENFPVFLYSMEQAKSQSTVIRESDYAELMLLEGMDENQKGLDEEALDYGEDAIHLDQNLENALLTENQAAGQKEEAGIETAEDSVFYEVEEPAYRYQWDTMREYKDLIKAFYAIDSTTSAGPELLDKDKLLSADMRMQGDNGQPQILIYHTHASETFANSTAGDPSTTIIGAGDRLAAVLRDKYGYNVIHHTEVYDEERDYAYTNSLPAIEQLLADNPSVEVVIDLHRDEMPADKHLVVDLQGRPTAQFMFFNGLSRTRKGEDIEYLENPYLADNLAFSFQMQTAANEYYPGIARRIYLKAYRYNMHLRPKSLLIELGAQNNTVEEIMNAIEPLAHIIYLVLHGDVPDVEP